MIVQARHQHQLLPTRLAELFTPAVANLFERLDAIGHKRRAHDHDLLYTLLGQLIKPRLGIGLDPFRPPQTGLERYRPGTFGQAHARRKGLGSAHALAAITHRKHFRRRIAAAVSILEAMRAGRVELLQMALGQPVKTHQ
ncbi:hypothetical protein D9M71_284200 [compost metagenome]